MTDAQPVIDVEKIKADAIQAAQDALVERIQGSKPKFSWEERGKQAPEDYPELLNEFKKQVPTLTEDEVRAKAREEFQRLKDEEQKSLQEKEEAEKKQQLSEIEARQKQADAEWYQLVEEGKMPAPSAEIQDKINRGEKITKEEIEADDGLRERIKLLQAAQKKSVKLAYYEDYKKEPAGAKAPVFGGRPSAGMRNESKELDYDKDVVANRRRIFGF